MEREKKNSSLLQIFVLVLFLCFGILVASVGTAFGRYKSSSEGTVIFKMREPAKIYLGRVSVADNIETFSPLNADEELLWNVDVNKATLEIAVSNGIPSDYENRIGAEFPEEDLKVKIRLISDLGLTAGTEKNDKDESVPFPAEVKIKVTQEGINGESAEKTAAAERILKGSSLFYTNGDGWVYSFLDDGKEIFWDLRGGELSYIKLTIEVDISGIDAKALKLEPEIIVERAE